MKRGLPRVLFTTPVIHYPPIGGPFLRIANTIKALSKISDLYLYIRDTEPQIGGKEAVEYFKSFCNDIEFATYSKAYRTMLEKLNMISKIAIGRPIGKIDLDGDRQVNDLLRIARKVEADLIWFGYGNISYPFFGKVKNKSSYKCVIDTDSVWSRFVARGIPFAKTEKEKGQTQAEADQKEQEEVWGTRMAEVTTAVSRVDADYYQKAQKSDEGIFIFSNVIDSRQYEDKPEPPKDFLNPSMFLAGTFWKESPMEDAFRWFYEKVMPKILRLVPGAHLYVIGKGSDAVLADIHSDHVTVTGMAQSVLPYLCNCDVSLVPLRFESGTRFKILEAGACGIPVVSTTLGAEGITITDSADILIADDPKDFADSVVRIMKDKNLAKKLSGNLNKLIKKDYDLSTLEQEGKRILQYLLGSEKKP